MCANVYMQFAYRCSLYNRVFESLCQGPVYNTMMCMQYMLTEFHTAVVCTMIQCLQTCTQCYDTHQCITLRMSWCICAVCTYVVYVRSPSGVRMMSATWSQRPCVQQRVSDAAHDRVDISTKSPTHKLQGFRVFKTLNPKP